ncbi:MAG: tetratricopeptide repeat protein [Ruminococcus sp.]|nr:tetratricopeptide repeat protein [Ruminococcus sp.]
MKTKIFFVLNILIIAGSAGILVWQFFFAQERDIKLIAKAAVLLVVYLLAVLGIRRKRSPLDYMVYEEQYKPFLGEAFRTDKASYRRLMAALTWFNRNKTDKAIGILNKLYASCASADDFSAVLFFKALCLEEKKQFQEAAACYEELLTYNTGHATAWSNLGILYQNMGKGQEAFRAFQNAVTHDPNNAYAHNNIASCYMKNGETEAALKSALRAIELNSKLYQAMGAASMAYKLLGDEENAEKYCRMYGSNGGNAAQLRDVLARM